MPDYRLPITDYVFMQNIAELEQEYLPLRDKVRELREYL